MNVLAAAFELYSAYIFRREHKRSPNPLMIGGAWHWLGAAAYNGLSAALFVLSRNGLVSEGIDQGILYTSFNGLEAVPGIVFGMILLVGQFKQRGLSNDKG